MDEKTARQLVRNTFDLLAAGDRAAAAAEPALIAAFQRVARLLERLPPVGDIMREQAWRAMKPEVLQALEPAAGRLGVAIVETMAEELKSQVTFATNVLQTQGQIVDKQGNVHTTAGINIGGFAVDEPGASAARRAAGDFSQNVRSIEAPWTTTATIAQIGGAAVPDISADSFTVRVPPSVASQISRIRIAGQTLERTFPISIEGTGATMTLGRKETGFTQFMLSTLDTRVRTALLRGDTTEEVARELIFDSMKQGLNLGPTANQLKNYARAAARTGLMDGAQRIQEEVWDANSDVIAGWELDATNDSRTCPRCFPLDGLFSKEKSDIPSTPIHPACVLGSSRVHASGLIAATRSVYYGDLVTIRSKVGGNVTVTAQHPMLTTRGWVPAIELREGDNLVRYRGGIELEGLSGGVAASIDPDLNQQPPTAEQLFDSILAASPVGAEKVPASPVHFHGDGAAIQGDVEVVWTERELKRRLNTEVLEGLADGDLIGARADLPLEPALGQLDLALLAVNASAVGSVGLLQKCLAALRGELSVAEIHRLALAAEMDARTLEPVYNDAARTPELLSQCLDALSRFVGGDQGRGVNVQGIGQESLFLDGSEADAFPAEAVGHGLAFATKPLANGVAAFPGCIELDDLLKVRIELAPLGGVHVYDFSAVSSTYIVGGLISHNCRCKRLPVTNTAMLLRAEGDEPGGSSVELVAPEDVPKQRDGESTKAYKARLSADRYYLTKGKAGGEMWVRRAIDHGPIKQQMAVRDLPPSVRAILREDGKIKPGQTHVSMERGMTGPQWLAKDTTTAASRQVALGGGKAGATRAALFERWVKEDKLSPEAAYDRLVTGAKFNKGFIPLKDLQKMGIELPSVEPIRSESYLRQQAKRAAAAQREAQAMAAKLQPPSRSVKAGFSTTIGSPRQMIKEGTAIAKPIVSKRTAGYAAEAGPKIRRLDEVSTLLNRRASGLKLADAPPNDQLVLEAKQLRTEIAALEEKGAKGMTRLRQVLLRSDINVPEANVLARGVNYRNGAGAWAGTVREFALMFNGRGLYRTGEAFTSTVSKTVRRGYYSKAESTAVVSSPRVLWHELMHGVEKQDPALIRMAAEWRGIRATSDRTKTLRAITGNRSYRSNEWALEDDWVSPYVGKVYRFSVNGKTTDTATEVLTIGAEHFSSPAAMFRLYSRDPDLFHLIVALTRKAYR